jgi:hypothetical protein
MRMLRPIVIALMLGLIGWLVWRARDSLAAVDWLDPAVLWAVAVMLLAWVAGQVVAGVAWWILLGGATDLRRAVGMVLATQIGKYLPGNVGQFVGRAYLARRHGVPLATAGAAITAEGLLGIGIGLGLGLAMLFADPVRTAPLAGFLPDVRMMVLFGAIGGTVLVALLVFPRTLTRGLPATSRLRALVPPPLPPAALARAAVLHGGLILVLGAGLWLALPAFAPQAVPFSVALAVFGVANVAGFVTPGAPGGLGVREAVIVAGLAPYLGADTATVVALALRAATVLGDVVICGIGWALLPRGTAGPGAPTDRADRTGPRGRST